MFIFQYFEIFQDVLIDNFLLRKLFENSIDEHKNNGPDIFKTIRKVHSLHQGQH